MDVVRYILDKPAAEETYPFGDGVTVFKVGGKMFGLASPAAKPVSVNLKCDPTLAISLRQQYDGIAPGYHMNKEHWNTIKLGSDVSDDELKRLVDHSYDLVVASLPKAKRPV